jgi:hypothetical protein
LRGSRLRARAGLFTHHGQPFEGADFLPANRQSFAMAQPAVRSHINMAPDVRRHVAPQVAFHLLALLDDITDLHEIVIGKVVGFRIEVDLRFL